MEHEHEEPTLRSDPVVLAAQRLLGVSYLYPYQRLVVAHILDGARRAKLSLEWPPDLVPLEEPPSVSPGGDSPPKSDVRAEDDDWESLGRQIVILPTGAGKSLCFQLPALLLQRPTLVIFPILSLQADQNRRLSERGWDPLLLRGGQTGEEREKIWNRLDRGDGKFIIANPEVLLTESMIRRLGDLKIAHVVVDEAHCVSEWGESFRPAYLRLGEIIEASQAPLVTAFTATASNEVLEKIRSYIFGPPGAHTIIGNPDRPNIDYTALGTLLPDLTVRDLLRDHPKPAIVFCGSRSRTVQLARYLRVELPGTECKFYHAGLERNEKKAVEAWFFQSSDGVLVATCAYGLGVDKPNIRTVIHRDCPPSVEAYLQESGRAGRDGEAAEAILLWGPEDRRALERLTSEAERSRLGALLSYGRDVSQCRRHQLLELLGVEDGYCPPGPVACDVCRGKARAEEREVPSILRFFRANRRRYTLHEAAQIMAEDPLCRWTEDNVREALKLLLQRRALKTKGGFFWKGHLTTGPTSTLPPGNKGNGKP